MLNYNTSKEYNLKKNVVIHLHRVIKFMIFENLKFSDPFFQNYEEISCFSSFSLCFY